MSVIPFKPHCGRLQRADWAAIRDELRNSHRSIRAIARAHGISDTAIRLFMKKEGVVRDHGPAIRARTNAKLFIERAEQVRAKRLPANPDDEAIVEAKAERNVTLVLGRADR